MNIQLSQHLICKNPTFNLLTLTHNNKFTVCEAKSTLDLIYREEPNKIDNLATGPRLADPRRCHISLNFDFIIDSHDDPQFKI